MKLHPVQNQIKSCRKNSEIFFKYYLQYYLIWFEPLNRLKGANGTGIRCVLFAKERWLTFFHYKTKHENSRKRIRKVLLKYKIQSLIVWTHASKVEFQANPHKRGVVTKLLNNFEKIRYKKKNIFDYFNI